MSLLLDSHREESHEAFQLRRDHHSAPIAAAHPKLQLGHPRLHQLAGRQREQWLCTAVHDRRFVRLYESQPTPQGPHISLFFAPIRASVFSAAALTSGLSWARWS